MKGSPGVPNSELTCVSEVPNLLSEMTYSCLEGFTYPTESTILRRPLPDYIITLSILNQSISGCPVWKIVARINA